MVKLARMNTARVANIGKPDMISIIFMDATTTIGTLMNGRFGVMENGDMRNIWDAWATGG